MADDEGASPKEQLLEACRRDNTELLQEVLDGMSSKSKEQVAEFLNNLTDSMGNYLLHICAQYGSYDVMDSLLDVEFLECDPLTRRDAETPLHVSVKYANERNVELGAAMVKMAIDAGCDPRVKDKHGRRPRDLVATGNEDLEELRSMLAKEEYVATEGLRQGQGAADHDEDDVGSASDSDA